MADRRCAPPPRRRNLLRALHQPFRTIALIAPSNVRRRRPNARTPRPGAAPSSASRQANCPSASCYDVSRRSLPQPLCRQSAPPATAAQEPATTARVHRQRADSSKHPPQRPGHEARDRQPMAVLSIQPVWACVSSLQLSAPHHHECVSNQPLLLGANVPSTRSLIAKSLDFPSQA